MPGLKVNEGDVLLFSDPVGLGVLVGQKIVSAGRSLDASIVHAGIVTQGGSISNFAGIGQLRVAHALTPSQPGQGGVVNGQVILSKDKNFGAYGRIDIWRPPAKLAWAAVFAGQVALRWAQPSNSGAKMQFSKRKVLTAAFGRANYGSGAQNRAMEYHNHRTTVGGPPSLHDPAVNKSVYCSMFVVAVLQAVLGSMSASEMDVDARYCSPMKLAQVLQQKGWTPVGAAYVGGLQGIKVVDSNDQEIQL